MTDVFTLIFRKGSHNRALQIFRLVLVFLAVMMLIFDGIGLASLKDEIVASRKNYPDMVFDVDWGLHVLLFLPDILNMIFYTTILFMAYRSLRGSATTFTSSTAASSTKAKLAIRVFCSIFLCGFLLYDPSAEIGSLQKFFREVEKAKRESAKARGITLDEEEYSVGFSFNSLYLCGSTPDKTLMTISEYDQAMWFFNGCVIRRARSSLAFFVSVLILVELVWSLRELRKNKQNMVRVDSLPAYTEGGCEKNVTDNTDSKN
ncbi:hypothetical protein BGZ83_012103 [Gryganskiella cystojenkinii]|nr:hypothetical protein BGZ83_012103 [Gryganskiella cystojenkinii]